MIRYSEFKYPYTYFHLNFDMNIFPQFKILDWNFLCHNLNHCQKTWADLEIHALVMMDTHVHLLFKILNQNENFFTSHFVELMGQKAPSDILVEPLKNYSQYLNTYKYIYRNPLEAGLCWQCETYPYSSLSYLIGQTPFASIHVVDKMNLIQNPQRILEWLNSKKDYKSSRLNQLLNVSRQENSFLM